MLDPLLYWESVQPPKKLLARWEAEAFLALNVLDRRDVPALAQLELMSAEDILWILAATDPSAAIRRWSKQQQPLAAFDSDLD